MTDTSGRISPSANLTSLQIVTTLEDAAFKKWFDLTLPLSLCSADDATSLPDFCIQSNLYSCMADAAVKKSKESGGQMFVYCGPPYTGKTTAGKHLIRLMQKQKGDNYPSLFLDVSDGDLYGAFRKKLRVPKNMTDAEWLAILFSHLSNKIVLPVAHAPLGWRPKLKLPFCGNELEIVPATYKNERRVIHPIIVIDQLGFLDFTNFGRLKKIYQLAAENRVLVYVLTDSEPIANLIAGANGNLRVSPVPGRFRREEFKIQPAETFFGNHIKGIVIATGISWIPEEWTRERQHEYVLKFYPDDAIPPNVSQDGFFTFLVEGENPCQAKDRADAYFDACGNDVGEDSIDISSW